MCGISILIDRNGQEIDKTGLQAMNDQIVHRGPDGEGIYIDGPVGLGHRRLAIIDLSEFGRQPMHYESLTITYNGELYNYIELREELRRIGYQFQTSTDTEVILAAYKEWGVLSFPKFNGMWAMAIYDKESNEVVFSRDQYGIKPLFYGQNENYFFAGSEIKQFLALGVKPKLNLNSAIQYLNSGLLNYSSDTFFQGVYELECGSYLKLSLGSNALAKVKWYEHVITTDVRIAYEEATNIIEKVFDDSVRIRLRSDVPVGSCLSGGIDSSSIVTSVVKQHLVHSEKFKTFSSCYDDRRYDERAYINAVVESFDLQSVKCFPDSAGFIEKGILDKILYHHEQPFSSLSNFSQYEVFREVRNSNIVVLLDGQGADEYLMGYSIFFTTYIKVLIKKCRFSTLLELIRKVRKNSRMSFYMAVKTYILNPLLIIPLASAFKTSKSWYVPGKLKGVKLISRNRNKNLTELVYDQLYRSNLQSLLHSADRNSMAFSLESRLPFLDYRLVEFVSKLPGEYFFRNGVSKSVFRDAMTMLPLAIKNRTDKLGFAAPTPEFVMANRGHFLAELMDMVQRFDFIDSDIITEFEYFIEGSRPYDEIFFRLFTLGRFVKTFKMEDV